MLSLPLFVELQCPRSRTAHPPPVFVLERKPIRVLRPGPVGKDLLCAGFLSPFSPRVGRNER